MNKIILQGIIIQDIKIKYDTQDNAVATFVMAHNEYFTKNGEWLQKTLFINCIAFGKFAEKIYQKFAKKQKILICGKLTLNIWQDEFGNNKQAYQIHIKEIHKVGQNNKMGQNPHRDNEITEIVSANT